MTEPSRPRPVPGPPRPAPGSPGDPAAVPARPAAAGSGTAGSAVSPTGGEGRPFPDLTQVPVAEHVAVFEAEYARLQRELGTIDRL